MKLFFSLVGISICGFAYAQQIPILHSGPSEEMLPGISTLRPEYAPPPSNTPSGNPTAAVDPASIRRSPLYAAMRLDSASTGVW